MERLGVGIIGCGAVAEEYVKAFQKDQRSEIRALVSRNRANTERYRDKYDLDCAIETDATEMLRRKDTDSADVSHHPFVGEVSHLLDCIIEDKRPYPGLEDAAQTHAVCFAADLSAESGRPIAIRELDDRS